MREQYRPKSNVIFDSINFADYNAFAFGCNLFDRPERDVDVVAVPGRSGDIILDNGRYKNLDRIYQVQCKGIRNIESFMSALSSKVGYFRLEDEYDSEVFFKARIKGSPKIKRFTGDAASITVTFDRQPQRFLKSDESIAVSGTLIDDISYSDETWTNGLYLYKIFIENDTSETYSPIIEVPAYRYGFPYAIHRMDYEYDSIEEDGRNYLSFGGSGTGIVVSDNGQGMRLDCASGAVDMPYTDGTFSIKTGGLPQITPGVNYFYFSFASTIANPTRTQLGYFQPQIYKRRWVL